jgi:GWxTD domain-containing protein
MCRMRRLWAQSVVVAVLGLCLGCQSSGAARLGAGARLWFEGPVRWLMLPEEAKQFKQLRTSREAQEFIEVFWRRRDPTPGAPDNPFRTAFLERSQAADRLYSEAGRRGSLTDRGRALILLGPPSILRYEQKAVPLLQPEAVRGRSETRSRWMTQEVWAYLPEDLSPALVELLSPEQRGDEIALVFAAEARRTYLLEGEKLCELAARAAVLAAAPP